MKRDRLSRWFPMLLVLLALSACGSAPPPLPAPLAEAERARRAAFASFDAGHYVEAAANFRDAERRFVAIDDDRAAAAMAIGAAEVQLLLGETRRAEDAAERAGVLAGRAGDPGLAERVALLEARLAVRRNAPDARERLAALRGASAPVAAQAQLVECTLEVRAGNTACIDGLHASGSLARARIERLRSEAAMRRGELDTANAHLDNARSIYRAAFYRPGLAAVHEQRAQVQLAADDRTGAIASLQRALYLRLWMHDRVHAAGVLERLAELAADDAGKKRYEEWRSWLTQDAAPDWDALQREIFTPR